MQSGNPQLIRQYNQDLIRNLIFEKGPITKTLVGTILGVKVTPVAASGVYVPGGRAQYPSTVLMDVIPAKVAGVEKVVMVTPPQKEGGISPSTQIGRASCRERV